MPCTTYCFTLGEPRSLLYYKPAAQVLYGSRKLNTPPIPQRLTQSEALPHPRDTSPRRLDSWLSLPSQVTHLDLHHHCLPLSILPLHVPVSTPHNACFPLSEEHQPAHKCVPQLLELTSPRGTARHGTCFSNTTGESLPPRTWDCLASEKRFQLFSSLSLTRGSPSAIWSHMLPI